MAKKDPTEGFSREEKKMVQLISEIFARIVMEKASPATDESPHAQDQIQQAHNDQ
jgi:hypothetical protein